MGKSKKLSGRYYSYQKKPLIQHLAIYSQHLVTDNEVQTHFVTYDLLPANKLYVNKVLKLNISYFDKINGMSAVTYWTQSTQSVTQVYLNLAWVRNKPVSQLHHSEAIYIHQRILLNMKIMACQHGHIQLKALLSFSEAFGGN